MSSFPLLKVEHVSKLYRLGEFGTGSLSRDLSRRWALIQGKEDPYLVIGESNDRATQGKSEFVWALKDINFELNKGEVLGIIGKNGAGKSTLLKILSRITGPTEGKIKIRGTISSLLEVGTGMHSDLTGRENIFLNGTLLGMTKSEVARKMDEIVEFAGIRRYLDTPVKRYSSGMKVRLGFAVAAHLEPDIIVVDEVLAVGDAEFQKKAVGKMKAVSSDEGRTIIFVSHNMASIRAICQRAIVIDKGEISFNGPVNEAIAQYLGAEKFDFQQLAEPEFEVDYFQVKSFELQHNGRPSSGVVESGDSVELKIHYAYEAGEHRNLQVQILLETDQVGLVSILNNDEAGLFLQNLPERGIINCQLERLPFREGRFVFSIIIKNQVGKIYENLHAFSIQLIEGDYFRTGKVPRVKSFVHLDQKWSLEAESS